MHGHDFDDRLKAELQHDDRLKAGLQRELQREADRLLGDAPPPVAGLRAEFVRRRRQRNGVRAMSAAAVLIAVGFIVTVWKLRPGIDGGPSLMIGADSGNSRPPAATQQGKSPAELDAEDPGAIAETALSPFMAIAILIPQPGPDGEPELVPAWYVPGQIEVIDARSLSPAERSAVSQLLGPDYEFSEEETI